MWQQQQQQHSTRKKKTGWTKRCPNRNRKRDGREEKQKLFLPKHGTLQNDVQITRQEPCDWPASHRTCFWLDKARYTWFCLLCIAFKCFWRILSQSEAIRYGPNTYHTTSHSILNWCTATRVIRGLFSFDTFTYAAATACWYGMNNGRSISNWSRFQSCSYANDVATTHVVYS